MKAITFTKTSTSTGNVIELVEFNSEIEALEFFNSEAEGLNISENTQSLNGEVVIRNYTGKPHKYSMNKEYSYNLEIWYK